MSKFGILNNKIVNYIGLRGNNVIRLDDYPLNTSLHKLRDCIMYDDIEQIILKNIHPRIKFLDNYDLEIFKQRYNRIQFNEDIRNDWNKSIYFKK
jgi:hypothetical protein